MTEVLEFSQKEYEAINPPDIQFAVGGDGRWAVVLKKPFSFLRLLRNLGILLIRAARSLYDLGRVEKH